MQGQSSDDEDANFNYRDKKSFSFIIKVQQSELITAFRTNNLTL